jgi:hypothetical protein
LALPEIHELAEFFPKTFDNTIITTYNTCPRKLENMILRGLKPKVKGRALDYGSAIHEGLACWYENISTPPELLRTKLKSLEAEDAFNSLSGIFPLTPLDSILDDSSLRLELAVRKALLFLPPLDPLHAADHRDHFLLDSMLRCYAVKYKYEPWEVEEVEQNFTFALSDGSIYSGIMDLVIKTTSGEARPFEHKTTGSLYKFGDQFEINSQVTGYVMGLRSLKPHAGLDACVNALYVPKRKDNSIKDTDYERYVIRRTEAHLNEFDRDATEAIALMKEDFKNGYFRKATHACSQYGGCPYRDICKANPGAERELVINSLYQVDRWDPLKRDDEKKTKELQQVLQT